MDQEDKQNIRLLLAAAFMHARITNGNLRENAVQEALKDADALLAEFERTP